MVPECRALFAVNHHPAADELGEDLHMSTLGSSGARISCGSRPTTACGAAR
ncbi:MULTISPECIES: hypothetical protein [unclassified Streptomyces]|uniref:hypothetical protein n=1 Tax=unclassified Streptomyces TaxID=2593676 RepID=UPI000A5992D2|nr:hypothetical protein [Streptomyces sp. CB01883]